MRTLVASDKPEAKEAIELSATASCANSARSRQRRRSLDAIVFTGGIGEHNPGLRSNVCKQASWLGISLNGGEQSGEHRISAADSAVDVPSSRPARKWMIARHAVTRCSVCSSSRIGRSGMLIPDRFFCYAGS